MCSREIYTQWCALSATIGKKVRISSLEGDIEGDAASLSEDGALNVRTSEGMKRVIAGDCIHIRTHPGRDTA
jgi:BirA family biotin operon repressor/biotin-[acetyl-CoA-carboxylase] ligase